MIFYRVIELHSQADKELNIVDTLFGNSCYLMEIFSWNTLTKTNIMRGGLSQQTESYPIGFMCFYTTDMILTKFHFVYIFIRIKKLK